MKKSTGNMYNFITHTWNPVKGKCQHDCSYCYMKRFLQKPLNFDLKALRENLGKDNYIFVCSGTDLFAGDVPPSWIHQVFSYVKQFDNTYLFQSKNPMRMLYYTDQAPEKSIFCVTIETNRPNIYTNKAPSFAFRFAGLQMIKRRGHKIMITMEPIMDFDLLEITSRLIPLNPIQINIGADSKRNRLPEPNKLKLEKLIDCFEKARIPVHIKSNLHRLLKN